MNRMRKFLRLCATERRLLVKAALLLWAVKLGLVLLPFRVLRRFLEGLTELPIGLRDADWCSTEKVVWAVETAGRLTPSVRTCLTQALAAQVLLLRRGRPARLHIGVVKGEEDQFLAHAWVESEGKVVIGGNKLERYTPLAALEGKSTNHVDVQTIQSKAGLR
jgi:hypothetical protein